MSDYKPKGGFPAISTLGVLSFLGAATWMGLVTPGTSDAQATSGPSSSSGVTITQDENSCEGTSTVTRNVHLRVERGGSAEDRGFEERGFVLNCPAEGPATMEAAPTPAPRVSAASSGSRPDSIGSLTYRFSPSCDNLSTVTLGPSPAWVRSGSDENEERLEGLLRERMGSGEDRISSGIYRIAGGPGLGDMNSTLRIDDSGQIISGGDGLNVFSERTGTVELERVCAVDGADHPYADLHQVYAIFGASGGDGFAVRAGGGDYMQLNTGSSGFFINTSDAPRTDLDENGVMYESLQNNSEVLRVGAGLSTEFGRISRGDAWADENEAAGSDYDFLIDGHFNPSRVLGFNRETAIRGAANIGIAQALDDYLTAHPEGENLLGLFTSDGTNPIGLMEYRSAQRTGFTSLRPTETLVELQERTLNGSGSDYGAIARDAHGITMNYLTTGRLD